MGHARTIGKDAQGALPPSLIKDLTAAQVETLKKVLQTMNKSKEKDFVGLACHNRLDLMEVCTPSDSGLSKAVIAEGGTAERLGLHNGYDMATKTGLKRAMVMAKERRPRHAVF